MHPSLSRRLWLCLPCMLAFAHPANVFGEPQSKSQFREDAVKSRAAENTGDVALATFDGGRIMLSDFQTVVDHKSPGVRAVIAREGGRAQLLSKMVDYDLLTLEAERRGYRQNPAVKQAEKRAAIDTLEEQEEKSALVTPSEISDYFALHTQDFQRPALRRGSHIQLSNASDAESLLQSLKGASRERFASIARERSEDARTRKQGGELGFCDEFGQPWEHAAAEGCTPEIAKVLFTLAKTAEIAPQIVAHDGAFSVVMLTGSMAPKAPTLDRVRPKIEARLLERARAERIDALVARLRTERGVTVNPQLVDDMNLPTANGAHSDIPTGFPAAPPDPRADPRTGEPDGS